MGFIKSALTASMLLAAQTSAIDPIIQKGTKFFYKNGTQFYMKGVAYQKDSTGAGGETTGTKYVDPLKDGTICERDIPLLAELGTNTIRTYAIDPDVDHSACMKLLEDNGIYVIADLGEPALSINRDSPAWDVDLFDRYKSVVDELGKYENTIGFFAGNEVSNNNSNTEASAYVKAAVRDTKAYIKKKQDAGGRWMGVGYAANDDAEIRAHIAQYFNCGKEEQAIDFWGYNIYSWCGDSSYTQSGYDTQVEFFKNYSVPVFFAEYGCNTVGGAEGRTWDDTIALYGDDMTPVFSGGIVYMYFEEENDYGLVKVSGDKATTMKNFDTLKTQIAKVDPSRVAMADYSPTNSAQACPPIVDSWQANSILPPTPDRDLCECMYASLSCAPAAGLDIDSYGEIFGYICENDEAACAGIKHDEATGVYGPYLMCNSTQSLGHVLDAYYKNQKQAADSCDFEGKAQVVSKPSAASSCASSLASASSAVASAATATVGSSTSGSGSGSGSSDPSNAATPLRMGPMMTIGDMAIGLYMLVAAGVGAGMILL